MKQINPIKPENFRKVSVPLSVDLIKEFFDNKEIFFLVNYSESKIKGNMFLTYISNLGLPCEIILDGATLGEKFELLKLYMETRNLNESNVLRLSAAKVLLESRGFDTSKHIMQTMLTKEECLTFIKENPDLIKRWNTFVASSMMVYMTSIKIIDEEFKIKESFKMIDDPHYVGCNVVQLYSIPGFLDFYFGLPPYGEMFYFKQQFEEYMFKGKNFFHYFCNEENLLLGAFNEMLMGDKTINEINQILDGVK